MKNSNGLFDTSICLKIDYCDGHSNSDILTITIGNQKVQDVTLTRLGICMFMTFYPYETAAVTKRGTSVIYLLFFFGVKLSQNSGQLMDLNTFPVQASGFSLRTNQLD